MLERVREFAHRHRKYEPLVFFVAGFTFDALLLHRIDDPLMLVHQAIYLSLSALLIAWDQLVEIGARGVPGWAEKIWNYREGVLHFMLGTLLNVYTIFYFKSGTLLGSLTFLLILAALLFLNEARPTRLRKHLLRAALFALCLMSYANIVVSIAIGSIGALVFAAAVLASGAVLGGFAYWLSRYLGRARAWTDLGYPFVGVALLYSALYAFKVLPPVPMSAKSIGIYRSVGKENDTYQLGFERSTWRFWENGDQTFRARAGDKIYCFAQIFSPTRFKDQLFVRWSLKDPKLGWQTWDAIPFNVVGGREEGYRGYTVKTNYEPGSWRVSIETRDGRELGRIAFEIVATDDPPPAALNYDFR